MFTRIAASQTKVHRLDWLGPHMAACGAYINLVSVHAIEAALDSEQEVPLDAVQDVITSNLGKALYEPESKVIEWKNYEKMIKDGLKDLHWHQWNEDEVT